MNLTLPPIVHRGIEKLMSRNSIVFNAVMLGEIYTRMRGKRAYLMIGIYLLVLSMIVLATYSTVSNYYGASRNPAEMGREMFTTISMAQVFFMVLFMISITSGSITQEREQGTFEFLSLTLMAEHHIIWGKLMAAVSFVALLLMTGLPVMTVANLLGGFSIWDVLQTAILIVLGAVNIGLFCLYGSASYQKTSTAMGANFGRLILFLWISGVFFAEATNSWRGGSQSMPAMGFLFLNPFVPVLALTQNFQVVLFGHEIPGIWLAILVTVGMATLLTTYTAYLLKPAEKPRPEFPLRTGFLIFWVINYTVFVGGFWHKTGMTLNGQAWEALLYASGYAPVLFLSFAIPLLVRAPHRYMEVITDQRRIVTLMNHDLVYFLLCTLVPFAIVAFGANMALDFGFYGMIHLFTMGLLMAMLIGLFYFLLGTTLVGLLRSQPSLARFLAFAVIAFFHFQAIYFASYDNWNYRQHTFTLNPIENMLLFLSPIFNFYSLISTSFLPGNLNFVGKGDPFPILSMGIYIGLIGILALAIKTWRLADPDDDLPGRRMVVQLPRRAAPGRDAQTVAAVEESAADLASEDEADGDDSPPAHAPAGGTDKPEADKRDPQV